MSSQQRRLARAFVEELRACLTEEELEQAVRRNRDESRPNVCHTHDFFDANEAMSEAFCRTVGRDLDGEKEADCLLWGAAWNLAKRAEFNPANL